MYTVEHTIYNTLTTVIVNDSVCKSLFLYL